MKAIILAAGKGKRLEPLTLKMPKPLIKAAGKTLLEHTINALPDRVNELIIVIGYLGGQIKKFCGTEFSGKKITYVEQKEQLGNGHALKLCRPLIAKERFFVLNADDPLGKKGVKNCLKHNLCLLVDEKEPASRFGVISLNEDGSIKKIQEKPEKPESNLVSTGVMLLDERIFDYDVESQNGEIYLSRMVGKMAADHKIFTEKTDFWFPIATAEDLKKAELRLKGKKNKIKE